MSMNVVPGFSLRKQTYDNTFLVQIVQRLCVLAFDFAVSARQSLAGRQQQAKFPVEKEKEKGEKEKREKEEKKRRIEIFDL